MWSILSFLGVLFVLDIINRNAHKLLPNITVSQFFIRKLDIGDIDSLSGYLMAIIKIHIGLKHIRNINDKDISEFDLCALYEVREYIENNLNQYVKKLSQNRMPMTDIDSHVQCTLKHGILDFYVYQGSFSNSISIKFQSFSEDSPIVEITNNVITYTYKIKSKHIRFMNPNIESIYDIKHVIGEIYENTNCAVCVQVAA